MPGSEGLDMTFLIERKTVIDIAYLCQKPVVLPVFELNIGAI